MLLSGNLGSIYITGLGIHRLHSDGGMSSLQESVGVDNTRPVDDCTDLGHACHRRLRWELQPHISMSLAHIGNRDKYLSS